jgi:hypothetical protein
MKRAISSTRAVVALALTMTLSAPASGQAPPPAAGAEVKPGAEAQVNTDAGAQVKPDAEAQVNTGAQVQVKAGAAAQVEAAAEAQAKDDAEIKLLYEEGVKAASRNQWKQARQSFLEAWKRKPHYQVAANLGRAELRVGKPRDATEHLTYFLREAPEDVIPEERAEVQAMLEQARAQIGVLSLRVDPAGSEVLVDGAPLGASPAGEVLVDPGRHVIEARREGYRPARQVVDVAPGGRLEVSLRLEKAKPALPPPAPGGGGRSPVVIGLGIGATVAAAGAGVVLVVMAGGKASERDKVEKNSKNTSEWEGFENSRVDLLNAGTWSFIGAGVLGAAMVVYTLTGKPPAAEPQKAVQLRVYPVGTGIEVSGRW